MAENPLLEIEQIKSEIRKNLAQEHNWEQQERHWQQQQSYWRLRNVIAGIALVIAVTAVVTRAIVLGSTPGL